MADDTTRNQTDVPLDADQQQAAAKDPDRWVTGDEPATAAQLSYLQTLATETDAELPAELSKADASRLIDELQDRSPRVDQG
ncbi:MAG TPA: DUF3072 domain-containing protein [Marmoricola sp.]|nr:DUF3072 domain-containing protein [Marmoricola sp.]